MATLPFDCSAVSKNRTTSGPNRIVSSAGLIWVSVTGDVIANFLSIRNRHSSYRSTMFAVLKLFAPQFVRRGGQIVGLG
jgi:hypothetical protein